MEEEEVGTDSAQKRSGKQQSSEERENKNGQENRNRAQHKSPQSQTLARRPQAMRGVPCLYQDPSTSLPIVDITPPRLSWKPSSPIILY
jgi:hypothetical protein